MSLVQEIFISWAMLLPHKWPYLCPADLIINFGQGNCQYVGILGDQYQEEIAAYHGLRLPEVLEPGRHLMSGQVRNRLREGGRYVGGVQGAKLPAYRIEMIGEYLGHLRIRLPWKHPERERA